MTAVAVQEFRYAIKGYNVLSAALVDNPLASGIPTIGAKLQREKEAEEHTENQSRRRYCTYFPTMKTSATAAALLTGLLLIYCEVQYGHAREDENFESQKRSASPCPGQIQNGIVEHDKFSGFSVYRLRCDEGFEPNGTTRANCNVQTGEWQQELGVCQKKFVDCELPEIFANGSVSVPDIILPGSEATFDCSIGFVLVGDSSIQCMKNGNWTAEVPTCVERKECPPVPDLPFRREIVYEQLALVRYTCHRGYITTGPGHQTCSYLTGEWTPEATTCENANVTCPRPSSSLATGFLRIRIPDEIVLGSRVTYACYSIYTMFGKASRICTLSGEWSSPRPTCRRQLRCSNLHDLQNGISRNRNDYIYYECNPGYELRGSSRRFCNIYTGELRGYPPTCLKSNVDCGPPQNVTNGTVQAPRGTELHNTASYDCNSGFYRLGLSYRTCESNGNWSGSAATCQPKKTCPTQIQNGILEQMTDNSNTVYSYFELRCDEGFELNGTTIRYYCNGQTGHGYWLRARGRSAAVCQKRYRCRGKLLPYIRNGYRQNYDTNPGSIVRYSCKEGYFHKGRNYIECLANLTWSEPSPECIATDCGHPGNLTNGTVEISEGTEYRSTVYYLCNKGFYLKGLEAFIQTRWCQSDGTWSNDLPSCLAITKECPTEIENGNVTIDTLGVHGIFFYLATTTCDEGYQSTSDACQIETGEWWGEGPTCTRIPSCAPPGNVTNGYIYDSRAPSHRDLPEGHYWVNSVLHLQCNDGYIGTLVLVCLVTGQWRQNVPKCKAIKECPLSEIENGKVTIRRFEDNSYYWAITTCDEGYLNTTSVCNTETGEWSTAAPTCTRLSCANPGNVSNGHISDYVWVPSRRGLSEGHYRVRSHLYIICNEGYTRRGSLLLRCLPTGLWSQNLPTCEEIDCGELVSQKNGKVTTIDGTTYGMRATYTCNAGYRMVGSPRRRCKPSGKWSGRKPICKQSRRPEN